MRCNTSCSKCVIALCVLTRDCYARFHSAKSPDQVAHTVRKRVSSRDGNFGAVAAAAVDNISDEGTDDGSINHALVVHSPAIVDRRPQPSVFAAQHYSIPAPQQGQHVDSNTSSSATMSKRLKK